MIKAVSSLNEVQTRLAIFRRTLSCLTEKARLAGGEEIAPPELSFQLTETRREIARLERRLAELQHTARYR